MKAVAIIDIGSNSVRLMFWADGKTIFKRLCTTRLGEGIATSPFLKEEAIERTVTAVACFYRQALESGAHSVYAFATAAVRSAENGGEFCARIKERCGLTVDVVSGDEEAHLALDGVLGDSDGGILDIGGASTEVCLREQGRTVYAQSFPVGAVRLHDACKEDGERLLSVIHHALEGLDGEREYRNLYAVGGTATTVAAILLQMDVYDAKKIQDYRMKTDDVRILSDRLLSMTVEQRRALKGLDEKRADIIAGGALLLYCAMKKMNLTEITLSDRDNLEGYLIRRRLG